MAFDFEKWDQRVRRDLQTRMSTSDKIWDRNEKYVRNESKDRFGNGAVFKGNLVREFEKVVYHRVVNKEPTIKVRAADTTFASNANDLEVVANDMSRIVRLKDALRQATMFSTYSMGWLEVGHPYAAFGMNPTQYAGINRNVTDPSSLESQWEEVDPQMAAAQGPQGSVSITKTPRTYRIKVTNAVEYVPEIEKRTPFITLNFNKEFRAWKGELKRLARDYVRGK